MGKGVMDTSVFVLACEQHLTVHVSTLAQDSW